MTTPSFPNPFQSLWLGHWCGLSGLAELPGQLVAGEAYGRLAGLPATLAARLVANAGLVRQFVADWRPALAAAAEAEASVRTAILSQASLARAQSLSENLRLVTMAWTEGAMSVFWSQPGLLGTPALLRLHEALVTLAGAYLRAADASLAGFCRDLTEHVEHHGLHHHEELLTLWAQAARKAHGEALRSGLAEAYAAFGNAFNPLIARSAMPEVTP